MLKQQVETCRIQLSKFNTQNEEEFLQKISYSYFWEKQVLKYACREEFTGDRRNDVLYFEIQILTTVKIFKL